MTKMPKATIKICEECGVPFKVVLKTRGRPKRFHSDKCQKRNWDRKHPRQAVPT
jgi:ribosomal protein L34E